MNHSLRSDYMNIVVRPLEKRDIEFLRIWRNEPNNSKYLRKIPYISKEQQLKWFEDYLVDQNEITFAIEECDKINQIVGSASLYNRNENEIEFGKILIGNKEAHGKRIGYHATKVIVAIAFSKFKVQSVNLKCYSENKAALRIYSLVGFQKTGQRYISENSIEYNMAITKKQFEELNGECSRLV